MIAPLIAYDATGAVVATLDYCVARDEHGEAVGLVDFAAHEAAGGKLRDIWTVSNATGSGTWPEWLGGQAHAFRAELTGRRITALVHRTSGYRRERASVEAAIAAAPVINGARDLRRIVGGPDRPLPLDANGMTIGPGHPQSPAGTPANLPVVPGGPTP